MCVSPPVSELLILITLVPLARWLGPVWSLVMRFVQSTAGSHEGRGIILQKCLALYLISRGFTWMRGRAEPHNETLNPRSPKRTSTANQHNSRPLCDRHEYTPSGRCQLGNGRWRNRFVQPASRRRASAAWGVEKAERIHIACKEWLIQFITVPCLLSATNAHTLYEEFSIFVVSINTKMHTTHFTVP